MQLGLIYRLYCFNFDTNMLFLNVLYKESVLQYQNTSRDIQLLVMRHSTFGYATFNFQH